jgi:hypothetical protein
LQSADIQGFTRVGGARPRKCLMFNSLAYDREIHFVMIRKWLILNGLTYDREIYFVMISKRLVFNDLRQTAGRAAVSA